VPPEPLELITSVTRMLAWADDATRDVAARNVRRE
jgi:hypothetical protein